MSEKLTENALSGELGYMYRRSKSWLLIERNRGGIREEEYEKRKDNAYQAYQQLGEMIRDSDTAAIMDRCHELEIELAKQKTVTREEIEDFATQIACNYPDVAFPNLITIVELMARKFGIVIVEEKEKP